MACPEVNCRSGFLDPFLPTDEDRIEQREYLEGVENLYCAAKSTAEENPGQGEVPTIKEDERSRE